MLENKELANEKIVCGKFDSNINILAVKSSNKNIRIGSINPNTLKYKEYIPISTDGKVILYDNNTYGVRCFFEHTNKSVLNKLIILTIKERNLILEELVDFDINIKIFEVIYPIFNDIKYISNISKNYKKLTELLKEIISLDLKGNSISHGISTEHLFKIERKLRLKNKLDYFFAFAYRGGYQEVFKLKEERKDRVVIAFDFNSMYVDCMMGEFLEPKSIRYEDFRTKKLNVESLNNGLYRVILKNPKDTFFKVFHPFKYMRLNSSYYFNLEENQEIELLLFNNEIDYYSKFFLDIDILEGFISKKTISHPLKYYAVKLYKDRLKYKKEGNHIMQEFCKFKLITIHSSTNPKRFKSLHFESINEIIKYLSLKYMIFFPKDMPDNEKLATIEDYKYFNFKKTKNGYNAKLINYDSNESIYSLSAQITANSRVKIIKTIERFLLHDSVEICYSNIDSVHISILKSEVNSFLYENEDIISNKLGDLKIESVSSKGYWFDVGRYWLLSDDKVDIFKNILFNNKYDNTFFLKNKKFKVICKGEIFNYVTSVYLNIFNAFSYNKKVESNKYIDYTDYIRYDFNEVYNLNVANESYNLEILRSKKTKVDLYNKIATV